MEITDEILGKLIDLVKNMMVKKELHFAKLLREKIIGKHEHKRKTHHEKAKSDQNNNQENNK